MGGDLGRFVGGHPLAGRERSGPGAARADLFEGRPWVLTPASETAREAIETVRRLVLDCGAQPVEADAQLHDDALAVTSHVPQIVASIIAPVIRNKLRRVPKVHASRRRKISGHHAYNRRRQCAGEG